MSAQPILQAKVNYVQPKDGLVYDQTHLGPGSEELVDALDIRSVPMHDARAIQQQATLDSHGFALRNTRFDFANYDDDYAIEHTLYPQVIAFLQQQTGANYGLLFDHTVRSNQTTDKSSTLRRAPVKTVHNDYTDASGQERMLIELQKRARPEYASKRFVFVNLWMPIYSVVQESPLAIADGSTFSEADFHDLTLIYRDRQGVIAGLSHSEQHRWFFTPQMRTDEAYLLKVYDSDPAQAVRWAPHTAFVDPTSPADAEKRTSIELRSILFFDV